MKEEEIGKEEGDREVKQNECLKVYDIKDVVDKFIIECPNEIEYKNRLSHRLGLMCYEKKLENTY